MNINLSCQSILPYSKLKGDAFWEFLFSTHDMDLRRQENLQKIIHIFDKNGKKIPFCELTRLYQQYYGENLSGNFLRELFCCQLYPREQEALVFGSCEQMFRLENLNLEAPDSINNSIVCFVLDHITESKDIFVSSHPTINSEIYKNLRLADKVFEIVPEQRPILLNDLIKRLKKSREYTEVKAKAPEAPHLEPIKFIGFLQLYWNDVFKIYIDDITDQIWIKRHVLHHQKPSQKRKHMKEIISALPCFPLPSNILTSEHVVKIFPCSVPTDGIPMQLCDCDLKESFDFVEEELRMYSKEVADLKEKEDKKSKRLHPNETFEGTCCLRIRENANDDSFSFRRCRITGQSDGTAMVQDVDYPWIGKVEVKNLYKIPRYLLGVPQTCVYGILENFMMKTENERNLWNENYNLMKDSKGHRNIAQFYRVAEHTEYSGRKKFSIFMTRIRINEMGTAKPIKIIPDSF